LYELLLFLTELPGRVLPTVQFICGFHRFNFFINNSSVQIHILLCQSDDGKGFDVELVELSGGLSEMRRRASTIDANLIVTSEINTGTTVKLVMTR
jgi:nitrate/nitrite-specific signal transduction histidine kinase